MKTTSTLRSVKTAFLPFGVNEFDAPVPAFRCKVYNDGSHYIATPCCTQKKKRKCFYFRDRSRDSMFDELYFEALKAGFSKEQTFIHLVEGLRDMFDELESVEEYVEKRIESKAQNLYSRKKRFRRKAYLNKWNYFVTISYDDKKHTAESFRAKLRRCLSNLHTRRGWKYMGVFEHGEENGRLHFHALVFVPEGQMIGKIEEARDYSTKQHKMQITHINDFFARQFGRNDFSALCEMELKNGTSIAYLLKYIEKSGDRIVYSRGIPTEISKTVKSEDIAVEMQDFVVKYLLFDDVIDYERDVLHLKIRQSTLFDVGSSPGVI